MVRSRRDAVESSQTVLDPLALSTGLVDRTKIFACLGYSAPAGAAGVWKHKFGVLLQGDAYRYFAVVLIVYLSTDTCRR